MDRTVLLMGYRPSVAQRLAKRRIPFVVWHDKPIKAPIPGCLRVIGDEPFSDVTGETLEAIARLFPAEQTFSHVLASTEPSVIPASVARRSFSARPTDELTIRRCRDKRLMKTFLASQGIPLLSYLDPASPELTARAAIEQLGLPILIKPTHLSGRQGLSLAHSKAELEPYLHQANRFSPPVDKGALASRDDKCTLTTQPQRNQPADRREPSQGTSPLALERNAAPSRGDHDCHQSHSFPTEPPYLFERFLELPEVSVESLVVDGEVRFTNITEYAEKTWINLVPSRYSGEIQQRLLLLNQRVLQLLGIEWGWTHAEYFIAEEQIYFGEIAIRPPGGYLMDLISLVYQFDAWDCYVANELELPVQFQSEPLRASASVFFHPGAGKLSKVEGLEVFERDPNLHTFQLLRRPGQLVPARNRVSTTAAYAIYCAPTIDEVLASAQAAQQTVKFVLEN